MEQLTGSKLGKEYVKAVYCHPAYLTYVQSTSRESRGRNRDTDVENKRGHREDRG